VDAELKNSYNDYDEMIRHKKHSK